MKIRFFDLTKHEQQWKWARYPRPLWEMKHSVWYGDNYAILESCDFKCRGCGNKQGATHGQKLHIDHKIPRSRGGSDDPENLWVLCGRCNSSKKDSTVEEWWERLVAV